MQFSKIKKRVKTFLAPSLQDRVELYATTYRYQDEQSCVWLTFDGQVVFLAEDRRFERERERKYTKEKQTLPSRPTVFNRALFQSPWYVQSTALYDAIDQQLMEAGLFNNYMVQSALLHYPNLSIQEARVHENVFIRGFSLLDRRVGKRTLARLPKELTPFEQLCAMLRRQADADFKAAPREKKEE